MGHCQLGVPTGTLVMHGSAGRLFPRVAVGSTRSSEHMHEAGVVGAAIERVVRGWPASRRGGRLELEIRDATRAEAGAVAFYASAILADRGFTDVDVLVRTADVCCALCGAVARSASPADPQCDACGAPLPRVGGPAVVCHEAAPTGPGQAAGDELEAAPCA